MNPAFRVRYRFFASDTGGERIILELPIRIGRNPRNNCPIANGFVSDLHAVVELVEGRLCVRDLQSKNGIYSVGGERLSRDAPVPLAEIDHAFVVGQAVRVEIEKLDD